MLLILNFQAMALVRCRNSDDQARYYISTPVVGKKTTLSAEGVGEAIKMATFWLDAQTLSA